jgi:hypothetical protein
MKSNRVVFVLLAAAAAIGLVGCSTAPTAPVVKPGANPSIVQEGDPGAPGDGRGGAVGDAFIPGGAPGIVKAGRFKLIFPKNALKMDAHIVLIQPDPDAMKVEFEITPAAANDFQVPVTLIADCSDEKASNVENEALWWWDAGGWQPAHPSVADVAAKTLTTHAKSLAACMLGPKGKSNGANN